MHQCMHSIQSYFKHQIIQLTIDHQYTDKVGNTFIIQFNIQKIDSL